MLVVGPGTVFAGRYRIRHKIARGGMSTVWEALDHADAPRFREHDHPIDRRGNGRRVVGVDVEDGLEFPGQRLGPAVLDQR